MPRTTTSPELGSISRLTIFKRVVLPDPLVPRIARNSPGATSRFTPRRASPPSGYTLRTSRQATAGIGGEGVGSIMGAFDRRANQETVS